MPQIVEPGEIKDTIENIVARALRDILIVSPVIQLTESMFIKIAEASVRSVKISILCATMPDPAAAKLLSVIKNLRLNVSENINAKCYFNESSALITSMGLDDMINTMAINTGIMISTTDDNGLYNSLLKCFQKQFNSSLRVLLDPCSDEQKIVSETTYRGFCISCGMPVTFNQSRPYCNMCRKDFESGADDIPADFCHSCGKKHAVSLKENLCFICRISCTSVSD